MTAPGKGFENRFIATDVIHHRIHQGLFFSNDLLDLALADDASIAFLLQPVVPVHLRATGRVGGDVLLEIFEDTTLTALGTPVTPINRNRLSTNGAQVVIHSAPTVDAPGAQLTEQLLPGGGAGPSPGTDSAVYEEWLLADGKNYLVQLTNKAGVATPANLQIDYYEPGKDV